MDYADPFGLCADENGKPRPCKVESSSEGKALGASLDALTPETRAKFQRIADAADMDLGLNATTNGTSHHDIRHYEGQGADIGWINGKDIGTGSTTFPGMEEQAGRLQNTVASMSAELNVHGNLGPAGKYLGTAGAFAIQDPATRTAHANHVHVTFDRGYGRGASAFNLFQFP